MEATLVRWIKFHLRRLLREFCGIWCAEVPVAGGLQASEHSKVTCLLSRFSTWWSTLLLRCNVVVCVSTQQKVTDIALILWFYVGEKPNSDGLHPLNQAVDINRISLSLSPCAIAFWLQERKNETQQLSCCLGSCGLSINSVPIMDSPLWYIGHLGSTVCVVQQWLAHPSSQQEDLSLHSRLGALFLSLHVLCTLFFLDLLGYMVTLISWRHDFCVLTLWYTGHLLFTQCL